MNRRYVHDDIQLDVGVWNLEKSNDGIWQMTNEKNVFNSNFEPPLQMDSTNSANNVHGF